MNVRRTLSVIALVLLAAYPAGAEEVRWRFDYSAARGEALKNGMPLMLDFSTDWCTYCKKLDLTTFKDPAVVRLLNEQFVPVKLDGNREKRLVEALRLQGYPTLILAAPDGKILKTLEGYIDAPRFRDQLQEVVTAVANPEWMTRAYQEATKAAAAGEYGTALGHLKPLLEDNRQRPLQVQARWLAYEIDQRAHAQLVRARQAEEKARYLEALQALEHLIDKYSGTPSAGEAGKLLAALKERPEVKTEQRARRAAELLAQARYDFRDHRYVSCLDRCAILATEYGDLAEGAEGVQLLEQIKANPDWMKSACDALSDRLCEMYIALGETWVKKGESQLAAECLQKAVNLPAGRHTEAARVRLTQIQEQPTAQK